MQCFMIYQNPLSLQKKFQDVAYEDVQNAVRVVEDIVNVIDDGTITQRGKNTSAKRKADTQERHVTTKSQVIASSKQQQECKTTVDAPIAIDITADFAPPDENTVETGTVIALSALGVKAVVILTDTKKKYIIFPKNANMLEIFE